MGRAMLETVGGWVPAGTALSTTVVLPPASETMTLLVEPVRTTVPSASVLCADTVRLLPVATPTSVPEALFALFMIRRCIAPPTVAVITSAVSIASPLIAVVVSVLLRRDMSTETVGILAITLTLFVPL